MKIAILHPGGENILDYKLIFICVKGNTLCIFIYHISSVVTFYWYIDITSTGI